MTGSSKTWLSGNITTSLSLWPLHNPTLPVCVASRRPNHQNPSVTWRQEWKIRCDDAFSLTAHRSSTMPRCSSSPGTSWQPAPSLASLSSNSNEAGNGRFKKKNISLPLHFSDPRPKRNPRHSRYGPKTKKTCRTSAEGRDKNSQKPGLGSRPNKRRCVAECTARDTCVSRCPIPSMPLEWMGLQIRPTNPSAQSCKLLLPPRAVGIIHGVGMGLISKE